tara:strand:+ start:196 stop:492 length:297 start_codon:yes stop_codon:yes gene_type:complete
MLQTDKIYTDGLFANAAKTDKQKEFIIARCAINVKDFTSWLKKNESFIDEKGYIRYDLKRSMKDPERFYGELNTYKPPTDQKVTAKDHSPDRESDLPF